MADLAIIITFPPRINVGALGCLFLFFRAWWGRGLRRFLFFFPFLGARGVGSSLESCLKGDSAFSWRWTVLSGMGAW